jgi:hypothetical protein
MLDGRAHEHTKRDHRSSFGSSTGHPLRLMHEHEDLVSSSAVIHSQEEPKATFLVKPESFSHGAQT